METFLGYARPDGSVGIRNHVAVIPSVACANGVVAAIARTLPEVVPLYHGHGCGRAVEIPLHTRALVNLGRHPNCAAVLVVGLGCEVLRAEGIARAVAETGKPVDCFNIQECGGSRRSAAKGIEIAGAMLRAAGRCERRPFPFSRLTLGLECGGSDAFSGITANPAVGLASDWLVDQGGAVLLTEDTEMIGTGPILARRANTPAVAEEIQTMIADAERLTHDLLGPLAPYVIAPGNMDGGMSSIREKSLGCIVKAGSRTITQVTDYAEVPAEKGVVLMRGPGYDTESIAGVAAAGAQLVLFTTGRGNPIGFPTVPVVKVASTAKLYRAMEDDMDVNAGEILEGKSLAAVGGEIVALIREVADGRKTKAEINRQDGIVCLYTRHPAF
ncbi:MAG TPA: UxaA family hydrolase [Syntrophales bacterium]|nr:UxaA family hydrolase [Syntrophales bacterium]